MSAAISITRIRIGATPPCPALNAVKGIPATTETHPDQLDKEQQ